MTEMSDTTLEELKELLKTVARAHHEATGGVNATWAQWYASQLQDPLASLIGANRSVEEIAGWLTAADIDYRAEERNAPVRRISRRESYRFVSPRWATGVDSQTGG